jgi:uncharacterized RDD family membrane protein YckC
MRFFAMVIDGLLIGVVVGGLFMVGAIAAAILGAAGGDTVVAVGGVLGLLVIAPLAIAGPALYYMLLETSPAQGTLGKQWMGLRVIRMDGHTLTKGQSLIRFAVRMFLSGAFLGVGYLLALFTQHKQALHDLIANTVVVERQP